MIPKRFSTAVDDRAVAWYESLDEFAPLKGIVGTPGDDKLRGSNGDDRIDGLAGADTMVGRLGDDTYVVDDLGDVVKERAGEGTDTVLSDISWTLGRDVENLKLRGLYGIEDLSATGNGLDNVIVGNAGQNLLDGAGGNDLLKSGGTVSPYEGDTLVGGTGDDTLLGGAGYISADWLQGGDGNDLLRVGNGANLLDGGAGDDHLVGGTGDGMHFPVYDTLVGGTGNDTLEGGSHLSGGDGDDALSFSFGISVSGGLGNDTIEGSGGAGYSDLHVDAGDGADMVDVASMNNDLTLIGGSGNDTLAGSAAQDVMIDAGVGNDVVQAHRGYGGTTTVYGGDGADELGCSGGFGACTLDGGAGGDVLVASRTDSSSITLLGGGGSDVLSASGGEGGAVSLSGGAGNDTLSASSGFVTLNGGAGHDEFSVSRLEALGQFMVFTEDLVSGEDHLAIDQAALPVGNGDLTVDGAVSIDGPGGFDAGAELVIVAADILGDLSLDAVAAAIGSANQSYAAGQTVVFMVDNGVDSWALYFQSSGADAQVSAAELSVLARLNGTASTTVDDLVWGA